MTHLDEQIQLLWLEELARITTPGAVLAISIIGAQLRAANMPISLHSEYEQRGFAAFVPGYSSLLGDVAAPDYYKEAYHSLDYIANVWGKNFEILECIETGHQDIVVLKAKGFVR